MQLLMKKLIMKYAFEYAHDIEGGVGLLGKLNAAMHHKGVLLHYELIGSNEMYLVQCSRCVEERSRMQ